MEEKKARVISKRSPNFPVVSLPEAIKLTKKLYDADGRAGSPLTSAYKHLGFKGKHGSSLGVISALKKYGLIKEEKNTISLTENATVILLASEEDKRKDTIKLCALKPDINVKLWNRYSKTGFPSHSTMRDVLLFEMGFNERVVDGFIKDFKATIDFADLKPGEIQEEVLNLNENDDEGNEDESSSDSNFFKNIKNDKQKKDKKVRYQDFTIPQKGKDSAILRLTKPVTSEDVENIKKWLEFFGSTIVDDSEDNGSEEEGAS